MGQDWLAPGGLLRNLQHDADLRSEHQRCRPNICRYQVKELPAEARRNLDT